MFFLNPIPIVFGLLSWLERVREEPDGSVSVDLEDMEIGSGRLRVRFLGGTLRLSPMPVSLAAPAAAEPAAIPTPSPISVFSPLAMAPGGIPSEDI